MWYIVQNTSCDEWDINSESIESRGRFEYAVDYLLVLLILWNSSKEPSPTLFSPVLLFAYIPLYNALCSRVILPCMNLDSLHIVCNGWFFFFWRNDIIHIKWMMSGLSFRNGQFWSRTHLQSGMNYTSVWGCRDKPNLRALMRLGPPHVVHSR